MTVATAVIADNQQVTSTGLSIGLDQALVLALERNPALVSAGYQIKIEEARLLQAGLRPNPELAVAAENFAGAGRFSELESAELTISLDWVLERGKRSKRIAAADAGVSLAETQREIRQLDVAAETASLFLDCLSYDAQLQQAQQAIKLAESTVLMAQKRVEAGRSPQADRSRAEAELARAKLYYEDLEHQRLVAMHRLAAQWADLAPNFSSVSGSLDRLPDPGSYATLLERLKQSPDHQRYFNEQRLRESEIRLAEANAKPNWRVSSGIRRFEFSDDHAFVAEITVPLPFRNKNQGRIAAAQSALALSTARQSEALIRKQTALFAMYQELQHSRHVANTFNTNIVPRVEQALDETERAYEAGRYGFYELSAARTDYLAARASSVDAAVGFLKQVIEIERLTGVSLKSLLDRTGDAL
ncbi:MAG: TolC family protein [Pseudomonadales bacterium]|nr:TolC family protein [Pseudomonadales bacterium]